MALKVDASFENGVFVPADRPHLAITCVSD